jgi:DNA mismatch endonuclease (patch repair protein)
MPDVLSKSQRSYCMSQIRSKDTSIEVLVRSRLHRKGLRFRKHLLGLPGRPDIVFKSARLVVFIDGDFWHGYRFSKWKEKLSPKWRAKIELNKKRDARVHRRLRRQGWRVIRVWENQVKSDLEQVVEKIVRHAALA